MKKLLRFPFASAAAVLASIVIFDALRDDVDLFNTLVSFLKRFEQHEIIIGVLVLLVVSVTIENVRAARKKKAEAKRQADLQAEQLRVVQVTMRTVHDIVNNCLNELQLLRVESEGLVASETLTLFDKAIQETSERLRALGDLEVYAEKEMAAGTGLHFHALSTPGTPPEP